MKETTKEWMDQSLGLEYLNESRKFEWIKGDLAYWEGFPSLAYAAHNKRIKKILVCTALSIHDEAVYFMNRDAPRAGDNSISFSSLDENPIAKIITVDGNPINRNYGEVYFAVNGTAITRKHNMHIDQIAIDPNKGFSVSVSDEHNYTSNSDSVWMDQIDGCKRVEWGVVEKGINVVRITMKDDTIIVKDLRRVHGLNIYEDIPASYGSTPSRI